MRIRMQQYLYTQQQCVTDAQQEAKRCAQYRDTPTGHGRKYKAEVERCFQLYHKG